MVDEQHFSTTAIQQQQQQLNRTVMNQFVNFEDDTHHSEYSLEMMREISETDLHHPF